MFFTLHTTITFNYAINDVCVGFVWGLTTIISVVNDTQLLEILNCHGMQWKSSGSLTFINVTHILGTKERDSLAQKMATNYDISSDIFWLLL